MTQTRSSVFRLFGVLATALLLEAAFITAQSSADARFTVVEGVRFPHYIARLENYVKLKGRLKFTMLNYDRYFSLNPSNGVLSTARTIDLEDTQVCADNPKCCPYSRKQVCVFMVKVSVRSETDSSLLSVHITVKDENDNIPRFPKQQVTVQFYEGIDAVGKKHNLPLALDKDFNRENRILSYKLLPERHPHFALLTDQGKEGPQANYLQLVSPLNAEEKNRYELLLEAQDRGGQTASLKIFVEVLDKNEFSPSFSRATVKEFRVSEKEEAGFVLTTLKATDADAPPNNRITYLLLPSSPPFIRKTFYVDPVKGTVKLLQRLDYETHQVYKIDVIARDSGEGGEVKSAQVTLTVNVVDWNDNPPVISRDESTVFSVKENSGKFSLVADIFVDDKDSGSAGKVFCKVVTYDKVFQLTRRESSVYAIETRVSLDREEQDSYNVTIRCIDQGEVKQTTERTFKVVIRDENDSPPTFDRGLHSFTVLENATEGTPLMSQTGAPTRVIVTDKDVIGKPKLFLEDLAKRQRPLSDASAFRILPNGTIITDRPLDAETQGTYNFRVCASDGKHRQCEEVVVDVKDVNDNRPQFVTDTYALTIPENNPTHGEMLTFIVHDRDIGNRGFKFRLRSPDNLASKYFHLKGNKLMLSQALDREKVMHLTFFVVVEDSQEIGSQNFTSQAKVLVTVSDRNDNQPRFIFPNETAHLFNVSYHEPVGSRVLRLWADDPDDGDNGTVVYQVAYTKPYSAQELFDVDASGNIIVCSSKLSMYAGKIIEIMLKAEDRGIHETAMQASMQAIQIRLMDLPPLYNRQTIDRRNLLLLILGLSALFLLLLLVGWVVHLSRVRMMKRNGK